MCYDISIYTNPAKVEERFSATFAEPDRELFEPSYHISAHRLEKPMIPVIANEEPQQIHMFLWGLIPPWNQEYDGQWRRKMANAKAETLLSKKTYKKPAQKKRCLILVDGFFEWRHVKSKTYPYYIYRANRQPFAIAGIWEYNQHLNIHSVSLITTSANPLLAKIHNKKERMPAILRPEHERIWIDDEGSVDDKLKLLEPFPQEEMAAHTISKRITQKDEDSNVPEVIEPVTYPDLEEYDNPTDQSQTSQDSNNPQASLF